MYMLKQKILEQLIRVVHCDAAVTNVSVSKSADLRIDFSCNSPHMVHTNSSILFCKVLKHRLSGLEGLLRVLLGNWGDNTEIQL